MKAIVYEKYGSPEVIKLKEVVKPIPKDNEVLIRIHSTAISPSDCAFRKAKPFVVRFFDGLIKPKSIPGDILAGDIEAVGKNVTKFNVGDHVFGATGTNYGAHAEYTCLSEEGAIVIKPTGITYGDGAALADGAITALPFLRDNANIKKGQKILINGASGSVGTFAVQLAKHYGAIVTGVCSGTNIDMVKSLGADYVIDYTKEDFTTYHEAYDIVFDIVGKSRFSQCKKSLKANGIYMTTVPTIGVLLQMLWTSKIGNKKAIFAATGLRKPRERAKDLSYLGELTEEGIIKSIIDRVYPLEKMAEAHRYVDQEHKKGNMIVNMV